MDEKLYDLCDWAEIEAIVYSEHDNPHHILGAHETEHGLLINAFLPGAKSVDVKVGNSTYAMEIADDDGFFAVLLEGKSRVKYSYIVTYIDKDGNEVKKDIKDPYAYEPVIDSMDINMFNNGIYYDSYKKMGAHVMTVDGVKGVLFAVWAPHAMRVSVVGSFNNWDGRIHQMRRLPDSGIHELFVPGLDENEVYKYEIKLRGNLTVLKSDPYAFMSDVLPANSSVVTDIDGFKWTDSTWVNNLEKTNADDAPMSVYEVHLGTWKVFGDMGTPYNYKDIAPLLADYVKEMGYTHIQLLPIMEYKDDNSIGYDVTGFYAPTSRYGTAKDFMYFVNYMHSQNIGVIIEWNPASFPDESFALAKFDGTCIYEHEDPKKGIHPEFGTKLFNHGCSQVSNFLISNALFWVEQYHVDGIRISSMGTILYNDYKRKPGEWIPNIFGGNENTEGIEFIKHLNSIMKKKHPGVVMIANDEVKFDKFTQSVDEGGLGFSYKWNSDFNADMKDYLECDPLFRKGRHNQLTFGMVYAYSEKYMLALSRASVSGENTSLISRMPGEYYQKFSNVKAALSYGAVHPGKKLIFMGQDMGQYDEWNINKPLDWNCLNYENHIQINTLVRDLNKLYTSNKALYQMDYSAEGFEWINDMDSSRSIISFIRKTEDKKETLVVICNFTPVVYDNYVVGVPYKGRYKEIFNSDSSVYGGADNINSKAKSAKKAESDGREYSISVTVPPLGVTVFKCSPVEDSKTVVKEEVKTETKSETKKAETKKAEPKNAEPKNVDTKKVEPKKAETKKAEPKKAETKKVEPKKVETKKAEPKKVETKKAEPKKVETKKVEPKKVETKKAEPKKVETKKVEPKKVETKKAEPKKVETKKAEPKKVETKKVEPKKVETNKVEPKNVEDKKVTKSEE